MKTIRNLIRLAEQAAGALDHEKHTALVTELSQAIEQAEVELVAKIEDGKVYVAEDSAGRSCGECALFRFECGAHPCCADKREDGREIIWVEEVPDGSK